jgi:cell division protein FtsI/penicillin-binding protein 2
MKYFYLLIFTFCADLYPESFIKLISTWEKKNKKQVSILIYKTSSSSVLLTYGSNINLDRVYSIGSLMKPISALILLEEDFVYLKSKFSKCSGKIFFENPSLYDKDTYHFIDNHHFYCSQLNGHGKINIEEAIYLSCNSFFINKVSIDSNLFLEKLDSYLYLKTKNDTQYLSELDKVFSSIGESRKIKFQLREILSIYDYMITSKSFLNYKISEKNRKIVYNSLKLTVERGTLSDLKSNRNIVLVAGKTGTSTQVFNKKRTDAWILVYLEKENSLYTLLIYIPKAKAKKEGKEVLQLILDTFEF